MFMIQMLICAKNSLLCIGPGGGAFQGEAKGKNA